MSTSELNESWADSLNFSNERRMTGFIFSRMTPYGSSH